MQRENRPAGRCHGIRSEQAVQHFGRRGNRRYRQFFERDQIIRYTIGAKPLFFQMVESLAARDAVYPGLKQLRRVQEFQLSADQNQDILEHIIGVILSDQTAHVAVKLWLYAAEQEFESFSVIALCSKDPLRFLF